MELENAKAFAAEVEAELTSLMSETEVPPPYVHQKTLVLGEEVPDDTEEPDPKLDPKESHQCQGEDRFVHKEGLPMVAITAEPGHGGDGEPTVANPNHKDSPAVLLLHVPIQIHD